jgi:hypothetical protein
MESPDKEVAKTQGSSSPDSLEERNNPSEDDNLSLKLVDEISELSKL